MPVATSISNQAHSKSTWMVKTPKFRKPNRRFTRINTNPKVQIKTYKTPTNKPVLANPYHYINPNRADKQNNKICPTNFSFYQEMKQKRKKKSENLKKKTQSSQTKLKTSMA